MPDKNNKKNIAKGVYKNNTPLRNTVSDIINPSTETLNTFNPDNSVRNWYLNYLNSPKYKERLENSAYDNVDQTISDRRNRIQNINVLKNDPYGANGSFYMGANNDIFIDQKQINKLETTRNDILAHEFSHSINASHGNIRDPNDRNGRVVSAPQNLRLNTHEEDYILSRNNELKKKPYLIGEARRIAGEKNETIGDVLAYLNHEYSPSENKSDIDAFRYMLNREGLYDAGKENFTPEILKKAKKNKNIKNAFNSQRLLDHFSESDLVDIMNNVAQTNNKKSPIAKNGIKMPDGGKTNKMPDPKQPRTVNDPDEFERARAARILELSKQWNVPTANIYSQRKGGSRDRTLEGGYTSYYTFDPQGNVQNSIRDYGEPVGVSYYTPADIKLQQQFPGRGLTVEQMQAAQVASQANPIQQLAAAQPRGAAMKWGGKKKKKAENGIGVNPYGNNYMLDGITPLYQDPTGPYSYQNPVPQQPMDLQPIQGAYPESTTGVPALQNPTPNIPTRPVNQGKTRQSRSGINFGSMNLNLGTAIAGLAGAANLALEKGNVARDAARNQRLTLQTQAYNPNAYGTGSQALFKNGGKVDSIQSAIDLLRSHGYEIEITE